MKTIKAIAFLILLLIVSKTLYAMDGYFKGDTIHFKFDKMLIEVASTNYISKSPDKTMMTDRIKQVQKVLDKMTIAPPADDEMITITFSDMGSDMYVRNYKELELTNKKRKSKNLIVFEDGTIFEKEFGRYCICFSYRAMEMKIFVDKLDDLAFFFSDTFEKKAMEATASITQKIGDSYRKSPVRAWVDVRDEEPKVYIQESGKMLDMLLISGGIGSGLVKNTFVSDINFMLGLGFTRKGIMKNIYSADWSMMYDFSESNENKFFELNHFVSLGWEHNFSNSPLEDKWYGFSIGYLVKSNNDFFKENTFRVSVKKRINDTISLKPELYFNDFFKNVNPGIRFAVAF